MSGGSGQLRRYHFRLRLAFLLSIGGVLLVVHAMANFSAWLIVPDIVITAVLGWVAWHEREPVRFLLAWRSAVIGVGLGHVYQVTNSKGDKVDKIARPQVRRLWVGPGRVRVHVLPVAGQAVKLEQAAENLAGLLGMSRVVIAERRPGLRSMRFVLDFYRPAALLATHSVEPPPRRRAAQDGGEQVREIPAPLRAMPVPALAMATAGVGSVDQDTGRRIGDLYMHYGATLATQDVKPVEVEYRPDIVNRERIVWRRTGFDNVPVQCRPGFRATSGDNYDVLGSLGCQAFPRLPLDERDAIEASDSGVLPCSECPHVAKPSIPAESVPKLVVTEVTDWRAFLSAIPVGKRGDGGVWTVSLYDTQGLLVVGASGAGKSGVFWALNVGLIPALIAGVVELRALDPKGNELYHGYREPGKNGFFTEYADELDSMVELLESAVEDMRHRKSVLRAAGARKFKPSADTPLVVIEIDELLMVQGKLVTDAKLAKRAAAAIGTLLTQGRSFGFMLVGGIQDPRKEALDMRDLFQITVALRMENDMAELVLSKAAVKQYGANTEAIPLGPDGAGTGFVMDLERSGSQVANVRAFWASDDLVTDWNDYLIEARAADQPQRFEAAQKASEQVQAAGYDVPDDDDDDDGGAEVIPLPQSA